MADSNETRLYPYARGEVAVDSGDGLTFNLHGRDGQTPAVDPTYGVEPVVYSDGVIVNSSEYTFNVGDASTICSITFNSSQSGNQIKCNYKWKLTPTIEEDFTVYAMEKEQNSVIKKDVLGRNMAVESYSRVTAFRAMLAWEKIDGDFWREIQILAESKKYTFDVERISETAPFDRINNLYITNYPRHEAIPGAPGLFDIAIEAAQLLEID